jgi:hypothetical protein
MVAKQGYFSHVLKWISTLVSKIWSDTSQRGGGGMPSENDLNTNRY